ncbi:hypothetical protein B0H10DRAFT_2077292 [Mycena sp. CBHHK59/15]|nr:hypothetical protein B0H10DRAFT_2077292 [Mycena sp. CBHHK59/15]
MPSFATFCDTPVSTGFDGRAARSCVSLDWVINLGLQLLMQLLGAEHSDEEPDDGELEGSGDDYDD